MKKCSKCGLPETYETIEFDDKGVCNICNQFNFKSKTIDWEKRKLTFDKIIEDTTWLATAAPLGTCTGCCLGTCTG